MFIRGVGTEVPSRSYGQEECWEAFQKAPILATLAPRSRTILRKVLMGDNGIDTRHLALEGIAEVFDVSPDRLHARFARHAPQLAEGAARRAVAASGMELGDIDGLLVSTCTGYLCPGLTSYVSERLGLRKDAILLDLVGQGCGAALPNLRAAAAMVDSGQARHVLCVCVEVCSAAFYIDDDPGVLISLCLFGDGAGAAVVSAERPAFGRVIQWRAAGTRLSAEDRDLLRFEQRNGMLRNILSLRVPPLAASAAHGLFEETLSRAGVSGAMDGWLFHAGGRDVLSALKTRFGLGEWEVAISSEVLRRYGNLSSPFVLFVLEQMISRGRPGNWWMTSFGAGFSCHGALLTVE